MNNLSFFLLRFILSLTLVSAITSCKSEPGRVAAATSYRHPSVSDVEKYFKADSVILIVVDALRADALGCGGYQKNTSPNIDGLANRGILFERFYSASPWTLPSFGSILTGFSPMVHNAGNTVKIEPRHSREGVGTLNANITTLAEMLAPIDSYAIVNNVYLHKEFGLDAGFAQYQYHSAGYMGYQTADKVIKSTWEILSKQKKQNFFMMVHLFDPHVPYHPPKKYEKAFAAGNKGSVDNLSFEYFKRLFYYDYIPTGMELDYLRGLYDGEVAFVDHEIGWLVNRMAEHEILKNTWIVITADHGEEFYEHGHFEHGHSYVNEVTNVPFIVVPPLGHPLGTGQRIAYPARHVDVTPTILTLLGKKAPYPLEGKSLKPLISGKEKTARECYMEFNFRTSQKTALFDGHHKIVNPVSTAEKPYLYDLRTDPREHKKQKKSTPELKAMKKKIQAYPTSLNKQHAFPEENSRKARLPEDEIEALRSLGYIE